MGGAPSPQPMPTPPIDPALLAAQTKKAQAEAFAAENGGRASTILTGPQGSDTLGQTASARLLGGGAQG